MNIKSVKVYIISPMEGKYKERSDIVSQRVKDNGFTNVINFKSIPDPNNTNSLTKTVIEIFNRELHNTDPFIILEDDCDIAYNIDAIQLPESTDVLYLGVSLWIYPHDYLTLGNGYHIRPNQSHDIVDYGESVTKINGMTSGHAIMFINREFMKEFIMKMEPLLEKNMAHDLVFATMHKNYTVLALKQPMFYQDSRLGGQEVVTRLTYKESRYC